MIQEVPRACGPEGWLMGGGGRQGESKHRWRIPSKPGTLTSLCLTVTPPSVIVVHMCDVPSKALYSSDRFPSLGLITGPSHLVHTSQ